MDTYSRKEDGEEGYHQFLGMLPREDREWFVRNPQGASHKLSEDRKLELRLGPPGGGRDYFPNNPSCVQNQIPVLKQPPQPKAHFLHLQSSGQQQCMEEEESSQPCRNRGAATEEEGRLQVSDKKTAVPRPNSSTAQKRTASSQVVGWPPIRSFRKNFASGGPSRIASDSTNVAPGEKRTQNCTKSLFVKINMDGIPIGRKVDLQAFDSYEKLEYAVDELFRDLAAQSERSADQNNANVARKTTTGLLNENGEYTLVYEDNEGDRMLVGDVPWHMFVSTVKRLRVLRSSELPMHTVQFAPKASPK